MDVGGFYFHWNRNGNIEQTVFKKKKRRKKTICVELLIKISLYASQLKNQNFFSK